MSHTCSARCLNQWVPTEARTSGVREPSGNCPRGLGPDRRVDLIIQPREWPGAGWPTTGSDGEPLAQKSCHELLARLCDEGYQVSLETSGAIEIANVDDRVMKIMDLKTPSSTEEAKNNFDNLTHITAKDQIKFVICHRADYEWSKNKLLTLDLNNSGLTLMGNLDIRGSTLSNQPTSLAIDVDATLTSSSRIS